MLTNGTGLDRDEATAKVRGPCPRSARGFTLVEVSIILTVLAVLSLTLLPGMGNYLRDARLARARSDLVAIQAAVWRFLEDTGEGAFRHPGNGNRQTTDGNPSDPSDPEPFWVVGMLISDGDTPDGGSEVWQWRRSVDGRIVDTMANHLVQNTPGEDPSARYRTPLDLFTGAPATHVAFDSQQGSNARFAWRGPYVSAPVRSDPWGNRYAVNVRFLDAVSASDGSDFAGYVQDVFILSAGPDEEIDTLYEIDGVAPGDDDLIRVIAGGSR